MPGVESGAQGGLIDPQLVSGGLEVTVCPHESVCDVVRVREEVPGCCGRDVGLRGRCLASVVAAAQVLELVREGAAALDLTELAVEPDPAVAIAGAPHTGTEVDVVDDDVRESAEIAPRARQVHGIGG